MFESKSARENLNTFIKIRQPGVFIPLVRLIVVARTLRCSKRGLILRAWIYVTHAVAPSLAHAETTSGGGLRVVAFAFHDGHAGSTSAWTFRPGAPLSPAAVDRHGWLHYRHAFLFLTPLKNAFHSEFRASDSVQRQESALMNYKNTVFEIRMQTLYRGILWHLLGFLTFPEEKGEKKNLAHFDIHSQKRYLSIFQNFP